MKITPFASILFTLSFAGVGCVSQPQQSSLAQSAIYAVPAPDLLKRVEAAVAAPPINLPVQDLGNGMLLTDWQEPFQGNFHVVRYWHERTRYRISIVPDFADAAHHSRLQIQDESQERPDEGGINEDAKKWHDAPNNHRPERSVALLKQIQAQLTAPAAAIELPTQPAK